MPLRWLRIDPSESRVPESDTHGVLRCDHAGQVLAKASRDQTQVITARFDLDQIADLRASWGIFRDRRPETYGAVATLDGSFRQS